ncbi:MAG: glycosyltransferase, partial [Halanaerobium sp.]
MNKLSALVLTYNEEDNIAECLESISWIERIVVVDSYSDDRTKEIC